MPRWKLNFRKCAPPFTPPWPGRLDWLGGRHERADLKEAALCLDAALDAQLADAAGRTRDLGGSLATDAFAEELAERIAQT